MLYNECIEQNDIQKNEILQLSHSTECAIEHGESCSSEMKYHKT